MRLGGLRQWSLREVAGQMLRFVGAATRLPLDSCLMATPVAQTSVLSSLFQSLKICVAPSSALAA